MKHLIVILTVLLALPVFAQQKEAKRVLDQTAANFRKAGGVEAGFTLNMKTRGQTDGVLSGKLRVKGEKFVLETTGAITWFDGETQWSYLKDSEEVNISNPTEEELQNINPYALLSIYEKGFSYVLGTTRTYRGSAIYEVRLTATDKSKDIAKLTLFVAKNTYQLLFISAELKNGSRTEISIDNYRGGQTFNDSTFVFDKKRYPRVEIIDLR